MIRNAAGRANDDAIRSLIIRYKLLGTREFFVIYHTKCGMEFFKKAVVSTRCRKRQQRDRSDHTALVTDDDRRTLLAQRSNNRATVYSPQCRKRSSPRWLLSSPP